MRRLYANLGYKIAAVLIAVFLWGMVRGTKPIERSFDIPIVLQNVPSALVATDQSADTVNVRIMGPRPAVGDISPTNLEYVIDVSGAKPGLADYEVETANLDLPRGTRAVGRSPARIEVTFERKAVRSVAVRPDVEGQPASGYVVKSVTVTPPRVQIEGARSTVLRLNEVVTEPVDVTGATAPVEKDARLTLGGGHAWVKDGKPVQVQVDVEAAPAAPTGKGKAGRKRG